MAFTKITNAGFGLTTGTLVGVAASFSSTVSVGGTLTYEDVTNVDSVGLITARNGIEVTDKGVQVGTGATVDSAAANTLTFLTGGSERLRINSDGLVTVGGNETVSAATGVQIENAGAALLTLLRNDATISDGNTLGGIDFYGNDGGTVQQVAKISAVADGTHGNNDKPTRLIFSTTADGGSSATERARIDSSGNFGLGVTSPAAKLDVAGNVKFANSSSNFQADFVANNSAILNFTTGTSEGVILRSDKYLRLDTGGSTERMRIDSSGNFGIGETSPAANLVVKQSGSTFTTASQTVALFQRSSTTGHAAKIAIVGGNAASSDIHFGDTDDEDVGIIHYVHQDNSLRFTVNASERMRIDSSGNMGLGTNSPTSVLHIKSDTNNNVSNGFLFEAADSTHKIFRLYENSTGEAYSRWYYQDSPKVLIRSNGANYFNGGDFGIGTESPALKLHVEDSVSQIIRFARTGVGAGSLDVDSSGNAVLNSHTTNKSVVFHTQATERMRLNSSGQLLIGTDTSKEGSSKLQCVSDSDATIYVGSTNVSASGQAKINFAPSNGIAGGQIICVAEEDFSVSANRTGYLKFVTRKDGTLSDRMYLSSQGDLRIGGNSNLGSQLLQVQGGSNATSDVIIANSVASTGQTAALTLAPANNVTGGRITCVAEEDFSSGANRTARLELYTRKDGTLSERVRITSDGYLKASNTGTYISPASYHEFNQTNNEQMIFSRASHASFTENMIVLRAVRASFSGYNFLLMQSGNGVDNEFALRGDGNAYADGSWNGGGADYAEFFEWSDGNAKAQDRRGISVVLDGDKIRESVAGEEPIGVISGNPSVVGDADIERWKGKYLRDDYGTYIQEDYEVEGDDGNTIVQQRRKLNPDYNPDTEYVSRENRPEWDCVGLMGKLRIRKGQITGSRWIKMRDVSDTVEEWLVR